MERELEKLANLMNKSGVEVFFHFVCLEMYIGYYEA